MKWEKKGLVYCVDNDAPWCRSHTANPYPEYGGVMFGEYILAVEMIGTGRTLHISSLM